MEYVVWGEREVKAGEREGEEEMREESRKEGRERKKGKGEEDYIFQYYQQEVKIDKLRNKV